MTPTSPKLTVRAVRVQLAEFRQNAQRLLPTGHPFLRIVKSLPDTMDARELAVRIDDWVKLLEE